MSNLLNYHVLYSTTVNPEIFADFTEKKLTSKLDKAGKQRQALLALQIALHRVLVGRIREVKTEVDALRRSTSDNALASLEMDRFRCANVITDVLAPHFVAQIAKNVSQWGLISISLELFTCWGENLLAASLVATDFSTTNLNRSDGEYYGLDPSSMKDSVPQFFLGVFELEGNSPDDIANCVKRVIDAYKLPVNALMAFGVNLSELDVMKTALVPLHPKTNVMLFFGPGVIEEIILHAVRRHISEELATSVEEAFGWFAHPKKGKARFEDFRNLVKKKYPAMHQLEKLVPNPGKDAVLDVAHVVKVFTEQRYCMAAYFVEKGKKTPACAKMLLNTGRFLSTDAAGEHLK